ncbi:MAG: TetR/AcrR family transcriptional regulator [Terriglobia bacterium]|jgi:AcrR family transcriptional regulator|nr:TetR/AcrR family transcriptional regulator [Terriglobia bacterium]
MPAITQQRFSAEDRRNQILQVATELFASKGYEGATTREIARRARVNEAIIFRHFPTKEELYWAVIEAKVQSAGTKEFMRDILNAGKPLRETFSDLAETILRRREKDQTLSRLLFFSALENHRLSQRFFQSYVADYYELLGDFIQQRIDGGQFRHVDAQLAARGFLGMVVYHSLIQDLFGGSKFHPFDLHAAAESMTDIWLEGMLSKTTS